MHPSRMGSIAAALIVSAALGAGLATAALADSADNCRAETAAGVATCKQQIAASLQNPGVCQYMANGQAPAEYLRCYNPVVLCGGMTKAAAQAQANADASAAIAGAKAKGYCK